MKFLTLIALSLSLAVSGCESMASTAKAADPPPALAEAPNPLQAFKASIGNVESKLDTIIANDAGLKSDIKGLAETVGNSNAGFDEMKSRLQKLQATAETVIEMIAEQANAKAVPDPVPLKIDAPPNEKADQQKAEIEAIGGALDGIAKEIKAMQEDGSTITVRIATGEEMSVREFIEKWYKGPRSFPGNVDDHLRSHGVTQIPPELTEETKQKWHAAIHDLGEHLIRQRQQPAQATPKVAVAAPVQSGWKVVCENGVCRRVPIAQQQAPTSRREQRRASRGT